MTECNERLMKKYLDLVMENEFPFEDLPNDPTQMYDRLKRAKSKKLGNTGLQLVSAYHPSLWACRKGRCVSPIEAWNDPEKMAKVIANRIKYKGEDLSPRDIRAGLSVSGVAPRVSVFKPMLAKYLTETYLSSFAEVFDPCAGFCGRMLGVTAAGKRYVGQDINEVVVNESNRLISEMSLDAEIIAKDSLYDSGEHECILTCPPYFNDWDAKEVWLKDIEPMKSTDDWVDVILKNFKCKRYVIVVDDTTKYKDYVVEMIENKSHFGTNVEKVLMIDR